MPFDNATHHSSCRYPFYLHDWGLLTWFVKGFPETKLPRGYLTFVNAGPPGTRDITIPKLIHSLAIKPAAGDTHSHP